ncbi:hypothetical protein QO002_004531 [Pararhizobium capsulatum DSM 1112]|uniref:Uncharacterized protein n=1 Tax=Pararhizobium capsulatum DSM 1112 TaxID=1121113 RepID=A0ABU0BY22_9HYPH|nr:hypothetical protein [Pararhizobium capsulatum]MDQ0322325.1 hypothetical protein [Pararhizobium capsulatum DSM 1112]
MAYDWNDERTRHFVIARRLLVGGLAAIVFAIACVLLTGLR